MDDEKRDVASISTATAAATAAARIGIANPGAGVVAAGAAVVTPFLVEKLQERNARKIARLTEGIEASSQLPLDEALTRVTETDILSAIGSWSALERLGR